MGASTLNAQSFFCSAASQAER